MPVLSMLAAAVGKARSLILRGELGGDARAREAARLAEARRLDADEIGRRADEKARERAARDGARGG